MKKRWPLLITGAMLLALSWQDASALIPDRRRSFDERRENVYMIIPAIASLPGAGVFAGILGSFSNINGSGIDAAVTQAETIDSESDIHVRAFALREIPLLIPGLTFEYWFGDIKFDDYSTYLPGRNSPNFTIPYKGEFDYLLLHPVWRLFDRRINLSYYLIYFKGFSVNEDGYEEEIGQHSARGEVLLDLTDDVIDPRTGIRLRYSYSMKAPEKSILGKNSSNTTDAEKEDITTRNLELSLYFPITQQFTLVYYHQQFEAAGREETDEIVTGGSLSLRGYPGGRWSDRYGMLNTLEGRYTIPTNTNIDIYLINGVLEGIQLAAFYETGQVSPKKNDDLFKDLHQSYGFGIRALIEAIVFRLDFAFSDEGAETHLTIDQPF
ncbi:MAG: BamA/TamA family outer membrane protein [bacterium]